VNVRTGKKYSYIRAIIDAARLKPFDAVSRFQR